MGFDFNDYVSNLILYTVPINILTDKSYTHFLESNGKSKL